MKLRLLSLIGKGDASRRVPRFSWDLRGRRESLSMCVAVAREEESWGIRERVDMLFEMPKRRRLTTSRTEETVREQFVMMTVP